MSNNGNHLYEFGGFRVDASQGLLLRDGQPVRLPPKTFELLLFFIARRNQVVSKEILMSEVWTDSFVEDANLTVHISTLRKALNGDGQKAVTIETFPKIGYRFNADVRELTNGFAPVPQADEDEPKVASATPKVRITRIAAAVLGGAILLTGGYFAKRWFRTGTGSPPVIERVRGTEKSSAIGISPNGEYLAHAISKAGKRTLMMTNIGSLSGVELLPPDDDVYSGLTFTKDNSFLYFVKFVDKKNSVYKIPILGGAVTKILDNVGGKISFSPNSERFCFVRELSAGETAIITAKADGSDEQVIATRKDPEYFSDFAISWSPDGKLIANVAGVKRTEHSLQFVGVDVETGKEQVLSDSKWTGEDGIEWIGDGSGLIAGLWDIDNGATHVWFIPYPSGEPRLITNDPNNYGSVGVSSDGKTILAGKFEFESSLWITPDASPSQSQSVTTEKDHSFQWVRWTADGRLLFASSIGGHRDIWIMNPDGSNETQLTVNAKANVMPTATADGRFLIFASSRTDDGAFHLWRANADASEPIQITRGIEELQPDTTPDGKWIFYASGKMGGPPLERSIWKVSINGGEAVRFIDVPAYAPDVSPDGKFLLCWYKPDDQTPWKAAVFPLEGGKPVNVLDIPAGSQIHWTSDGQGVSYIKFTGIGGVYNIWTQPIDGKPAKHATQFKSDEIVNFDWSKDGRLVTSHSSITRDAFLIRNFR